VSLSKSSLRIRSVGHVVNAWLNRGNWFVARPNTKGGIVPVKLLARGVYFEIKFVVNKNAKILTTSKKKNKEIYTKNNKKKGKGFPLCVVFCGRWAIACCLNASAYLNENPQGPHKYVCLFGSMLCKNLLLWSKIF